MKITVANEFKLTRRGVKQDGSMIGALGLSFDEYHELTELFPPGADVAAPKTNITQDYHPHFKNPLDKVNDWQDQMASAFASLSMEPVPLAIYLSQEDVEDGRGFLYSRGVDYTFLGGCVGLKTIMRISPATRIFGGRAKARGHGQRKGSGDHDYDAQRFADKFRHEKLKVTPATAKLLADNEKYDEDSGDEGLSIAQLKARIGEGVKKLMRFGLAQGHKEQNATPVREQDIYGDGNSDVDMDRDSNATEQTRPIYADEHDPRWANVGTESHVFVQGNSQLYRTQINFPAGHQPSAAPKAVAPASTRTTRHATPSNGTYAPSSTTTPKSKASTAPRKFAKPAAAAKGASPKPATPKAKDSILKLNKKKVRSESDDEYVDEEEDTAVDLASSSSSEDDTLVGSPAAVVPAAQLGDGERDRASGQQLSSSPASASKKNKVPGQQLSSSPASATKKNKASGQLSSSPGSASTKDKGKQVARD